MVDFFCLPQVDRLLILLFVRSQDFTKTKSMLKLSTQWVTLTGFGYLSSIIWLLYHKVKLFITCPSSSLWLNFYLVLIVIKCDRSRLRYYWFWKYFILKIGPIPTEDSVGKEVISRMTANMVTEKVFYTDSNGRDFLKRVTSIYRFLLISVAFLDSLISLSFQRSIRNLEY